MVALEERFMLPSHVSPRARLWDAAHAALVLPLQLTSRVRHFTGSAGGAAWRVACIADANGPLRMAARVVGPLLPAGNGPRRALWSASGIEVAGADLVAARIHPWLAPRLRAADWLIVPETVRWIGDLSAVPPGTPGKSLRSDLKKIAEAAYRLEVAEQPRDWDEFYSTMLLPQARVRFGEEAWIPSRPLRREVSQRGTLLFVVRAGTRVGGVCGVPAGDLVWLPFTGVLAGDPALLREGVTAAAMVLALRWARERGFAFVDLGRTSPFRNDGLQSFKRKLGLRPFRDPLAHLVAIRADTSRPHVRSAFAAQPVLVETAHGLGTFSGTPQIGTAT